MVFRLLLYRTNKQQQANKQKNACDALLLLFCFLGKKGGGGGNEKKGKKTQKRTFPSVLQAKTEGRADKRARGRVLVPDRPRRLQLPVSPRRAGQTADDLPLDRGRVLQPAGSQSRLLQVRLEASGSSHRRDRNKQWEMLHRSTGSLAQARSLWLFVPLFLW